MTFDPNDPRLTAYALGELDGDDQKAVASLISENDQARQFIDETRRLAGLLSESLRAEHASGLDPARRGTIAAHLDAPQAPVAPRRFPLRPLALAAASLLLAGGALAFWISRATPGEHAQYRLFARTASPHEPPAAAGRPPLNITVTERGSLESGAAPPSRLDAATIRGYDQSEGGQHSTPFRTHGGLGPGYETGQLARDAQAQPSATSGPAPMETDYDAVESENTFLSLQTASAQPAPSAPDESANDSAASATPEPSMEMNTRGRQPEAGKRASGRAQSLSALVGSQSRSFNPRSPSEGNNAVKPGEGFAQLTRKRRGQSGQSGQPQAPSARSNVLPPVAEDRRGGLQAETLRAMDELQPDAAQPNVPAEAKLGLGQPNGNNAPDREKRLRVLSAAPDLGGQMGAKGMDKFAAISGSQPLPNQPQQPANQVQAQIRQAIEPPNTEEYAPLVENDFEPVSAAHTLSTFSIDVDTASYANVRRFLNRSMLPPPDSIRIEEMVNYFSYHYPSPDGDVPFSVNTEVTRCPWNPDHQIVRIGLKGKEIRFEDRKPSNLVFLVDISGSMTPPNKLPLVKAGLRMLAEQLSENDRISIVVYAGQVGMALPSTTGDHKQTIVRAIDALQSGGSTNGAGGIEMAYDQAVKHFIDGGVNRVILATDGDFNVGTSDAGSLARIAEQKAKSGVFLSVLGVGEGNLNDHLMESIADKGNGNYSYLDNLNEARKVLVEQVGGTLVTIAKDVKIQVDFNPSTVGAYRLIGYENRKLANRDFRDDTKDAGEIGSGHTVTALYEIIPPGEEADKLTHAPEPSKYVKPAQVDENHKDLLTVRLRYKAPDGQTSQEIQHPVPAKPEDLGRASSDTKFAASVAEFGLLLRNSKYKAQSSYDAVLELARANLGDDPSGRRHEFVELVEKAKTLPPR